MSDLVYTEKPLPAVTVSQLSATVEDMSQLGATIGPLFQRLITSVAAAGGDLEAPILAWYAAAGDVLQIGVCVPLPDGADPVPGTELARLEAVPRAITVVHHGDVHTIGDSWQALQRYVGAAGVTPVGVCREVYLATPMGREDDWVTELQQPVS